MSDAFLIGQVSRIRAQIRDLDGVLVDPGGLALKYRYGNGPVTTLLYGVDADIVRDGIGAFHCDLPLMQSGSLYYRWESNASNTGADEGKIPVAAGRFS